MIAERRRAAAALAEELYPLIGQHPHIAGHLYARLAAEFLAADLDLDKIRDDGPAGSVFAGPFAGVCRHGIARYAYPIIKVEAEVFRLYSEGFDLEIDYGAHRSSLGVGSALTAADLATAQTADALLDGALVVAAWQADEKEFAAWLETGLRDQAVAYTLDPDPVEEGR